MSGYRVELIAGVDRLGPEWDALFRAGPGVQSRRAWFAASAEAALPAGTTSVMAGIAGPDGPAGLVPMVAGPGRRWASLTTPYTCLFQPLVRPGQARAVAAAFGRACRPHPLTLLEALDPEWPDFAAFRAGLGDAGLQTRQFAHFGNWHESVAGWPEYLQARPGTLRETIRRKTNLVARDSTMRLEFVRDPAALAPALAAYETVYASSWKPPEPHPHFNRALIDALASSGVMRIGLLWAGSRPVAAQYWTVSAGIATVLKLAHDDAYRQFSPGTVLTAFAIRSLIEADGATTLDFGRGDDPYKRAWASQRRERVGVLAMNPLSLRGATALARHDLGRLIRTDGDVTPNACASSTVSKETHSSVGAAAAER